MMFSPGIKKVWVRKHSSLSGSVFPQGNQYIHRTDCLGLRYLNRSRSYRDSRFQRLKGCTVRRRHLSGYDGIGVRLPEGVSLKPLKHWCAVTRRRLSQTAETLVCDHPKAFLSDHRNIGGHSVSDRLPLYFYQDKKTVNPLIVFANQQKKWPPKTEAIPDGIAAPQHEVKI
ncbi:hypothetical protein E3O66_14410 [Salmonella enterica subsp. enterica serovar Oslo]|nr:hypothetical protein [Salmonella enterica]ECF3780380.1 hypothetical protein [Salmonella enterica subsp. enterica serovar Oslo]ECG6796303.1 hypothetical protein [Salmonella enterica subsp. enterica serovar Oslo]EGM7044936.1 hypothetical protein [Salmonella enterica subsp. enterica serovar Oslo]EHI5302100.1 hypothetical protein [Salmonella enterica]